MVNAKPIISTALTTDALLAEIVPKNRIFNGVADFEKTPIYPYITFEELSNVPLQHQDDHEVYSEVVFKLHVWHVQSTSTLAEHIDRILKSSGFRRRHAGDIDDYDETGRVVHHKVMSYAITLKN